MSKTSKKVGKKKGPSGDRLYAEIERRFGIMPNFLRVASEGPELIAALWSFAKFAYLDNPLPSLFKERLFVRISRFCEVRYCLIRHIGFLVGLGYPSGDKRSPIQTIEEVMQLLRRSLPRGEHVAPFYLLLQGLSEPMARMPAPDSDLERAIFICASHIFLQTPDAAKSLDALRYGLGQFQLQYLLVFLAFVRATHYWSKVHENLELEEDVKELLATHKTLADAVFDDPELSDSELTQAQFNELAFLRDEQQRNQELIRVHRGQRERDERTLFQTGNELARRVEELEKANREIAEGRRAALNVMEDAINSREALEQNQERQIFLLELSDALYSLTDPMQIQQASCRMLIERLGADRVGYAEPQEQGQLISATCHSKPGLPILKASYRNEGYGRLLVRDLAATGARPNNNILGDCSVLAEEKMIYDVLQIGAVLHVPLIKAGKTLAILFVHHRDAHEWSEEEIVLAGNVLERTWDAVERARAELKIAMDLHDTQLLRELAWRMVPEQEMQVLYQEIISAAITLTHADAGMVQMLDEQSQELVLLATQGFGHSLTDHFHRMGASSTTSYGVALAKGERIFIDFDVRPERDPDGDLRRHLEAGFRSAQSTPLVTRSGRPIGMLSTHWHGRRRATERELRFLDLLARQAADLIEGKRTDKFLQLSKETAEQANRMKDEFLATISHELRTPLSAVLLWSKILQGSRDAAQIQEGLRAILHSAEAQKELIEDLLDVSRITRGDLRLHLRQVELVPIIRDAIEAILPAAEGRGITITTDLDPNVGTARLDPERIRQVVWNLLTNAVKFTPEQGRVSIELAGSDHHMQIRVSDTGQGISADFLPYICDRFRQGDATSTRRLGGLGLGLSIARELVELHGGSISAESPGTDQGSTFIILLPVPQTSRRALDKSEMKSSDKVILLDGLRILFVEDDADSRTAVSTVLRDGGAEVTAVNSAAAAFQSFIASPPDLIISDIGLPVEDGYSLIRRIRQEEKSHNKSPTPALALTAYARETDRQMALDAGFQQHLGKPVDPDQLLEFLGVLLPEKQRGMSVTLPRFSARGKTPGWANITTSQSTPGEALGEGYSGMRDKPSA